LKNRTLSFLLDVEPKPMSNDDGWQSLQHKVMNAKKCAVVSSSGVLLHHRYGDAIDSSDLVFRFNDAELEGDYRDSVGTKENIRILNRKTVNGGYIKRRPPLQQDAIYLLTRHNRSDLNISNITADIRKGNPLVHFAYADGGVMERTARKILVERYPEPEWLNSKLRSEVLTSGYRGIIMAMFVCDEVWAYGFADTTGSKVSTFHYYGELRSGNASFNKESIHRHTSHQEKLLYREMAMNDDLDSSDVAVIPGFSKLEASCEHAFHLPDVITNAFNNISNLLGR